MNDFRHRARNVTRPPRPCRLNTRMIWNAHGKTLSHIRSARYWWLDLDTGTRGHPLSGSTPVDDGSNGAPVTRSWYERF